jgi:hypothetical protein
MADKNFTLIDDGRVCGTDARIMGDRVYVSAPALQVALGWELKPEGLCKDDRCVPVRGHTDLIGDAGVDLAAFAALLSRPLAIDLDEGVACLGAAAADRSAQLASLEAPDFTLSDLNGTPHSLSDYRGKKVLLVAYASW